MTRRLYFAITKRCNLQCAHCFNGSGVTGTDELTCDQVCRVLQAGKDDGFTEVQLTGGEPLIREDIFQIIEWARRKKLVVYLQSNGVIGETVMKKLENADPQFLRFIISLDGFKTNSRFRGSTVTDRSVQSIQILSSRFNLRINTLLSAYMGQDEIDALILLAQSTGAALAFNPVIPMGRSKLDDMMPPEQYFFQMTRIRGDQVRCGFSCDGKTGSFQENEDCSVRHGQGFFVAANGDCYPCGFLEDVPGMRLGNIFEAGGDIRRLFKNYPAGCHGMAEECVVCDLHLSKQCHGGCPARIYACNRRFDVPEYYCMRKYGEEVSNAAHISRQNGVGWGGDF